MTAQLARAFFDLLWPTVTWNWGQTSTSGPRMKKEASAKSIPWWQCIAVAWNGTTLDASRNEPSKNCKSSLCLGRVRYVDAFTDAYNIIAYKHVI